ncbi:MAG: hypothetical protein MUC42_18105, partial [Bryobacter sp.]|nr:hypothetical protein [Bryobacter sp.]
MVQAEKEAAPSVPPAAGGVSAVAIQPDERGAPDAARVHLRVTHLRKNGCFVQGMGKLRGDVPADLSPGGYGWRT